MKKFLMILMAGSVVQAMDIVQLVEVTGTQLPSPVSRRKTESPSPVSTVGYESDRRSPVCGDASFCLTPEQALAMTEERAGREALLERIHDDGLLGFCYGCATEHNAVDPNDLYCSNCVEKIRAEAAAEHDRQTKAIQAARQAAILGFIQEAAESREAAFAQCAKPRR